jgi:hypothetical protein
MVTRVIVFDFSPTNGSVNAAGALDFDFKIGVIARSRSTLGYLASDALSLFIAFRTFVRFLALIIHSGSELASVEFLMPFSIASVLDRPIR